MLGCRAVFLSRSAVEHQCEIRYLLGEVPGVGRRDQQPSKVVLKIPQLVAK